MSFVLHGAHVYDENFDLTLKDVYICDDKICDAQTEDSTVFDLTGLTVLPGLIDIHIHGCVGHDTCDGTPEAILGISNHLVTMGITSFCPTSMTLSNETLKNVFINIKNVKDSLDGAYIHGINMEGPYISVAKKGAQSKTHVRHANAREFHELNDASGGLIAMVDIAPEEPGALQFIKETAPICPVSIAHTNATYAETIDAFSAGVRHVTHLYNAMTGMTHREPGVVGAVFDSVSSGVRAELICDGHHIHDAMLRLAFRTLGEDSAVIVSDSMKAAGMADGEYDLGGQSVYVSGGLATLSDGTISASTTNMLDSLKHVLSIGVDQKSAVKAATINAAKSVRVDKMTGSIKKGKFADLVVVDNDFNVKLVFVKGKLKVNKL